jgi:HNH endonuclease
MTTKQRAVKGRLFTTTPIDCSEVREWFRYDVQSGEIFWNKTGYGVFPGKRAGANIKTGPDKRPYRGISFKGNVLLAHRVAWVIARGAIPQGMTIDHIDGDGLNNKLNNLRLATRPVNNRNKRLYKNNTSGCAGVTWIRREAKWIAFAYHDGARKHLGTFVDIADAIACRKAAEAKLGFHANHGKQKIPCG